MAVCKRVNEHILLKTVFSLHFELFFNLVLFPQMLMCEEVIEDKNKKKCPLYTVLKGKILKDRNTSDI